MKLDINLVRSVVTVLWFALFVAIAVNAWSRRPRKEFEAAARLPLEPWDGSSAREEAR